MSENQSKGPAVIDAGLKWAHALAERQRTELLVLHHAAGNGSVEAIHREHLDRGWSGIAYHYYVRKDGAIYRGRPEWATGGHTLGENWRSLGVCFEGNFEIEEMGPEQLKSGGELVADIRARYPGIEVKRHRELGVTACPGENFPFDEILEYEEEQPVVYAKLGDVPEYYRPTIRKLMEKKALVGVSDPDPNSFDDNVINVDEIYCRVMTTLDRMGKI